MTLLRRFIFVTAMMLSILPVICAQAQIDSTRIDSTRNDPMQDGSAQDSLVRLLDARSAQLLEINGQSCRKVVGPARFLHNNTYLLCDTALWNVDTELIDAIGNVRIIQDGTTLESDKMQYFIAKDLAQFRGTVVQLWDKDHNTLRTSHLDYNTKDSVAVFRDGGAMRDKDGQIIESRTGTYDSKIKVFTFVGDVNMFTDSIFVKTAHLKYESDLSLATFGGGTDAWSDDNMLSSDAGWYDRTRELFFFNRKVHVMSDTQEGWSDSLYFSRNTMDVEMLGNAQVTDTSRNVSALAGRILYEDALSKVTMTRKPAVVSEVTEGESRDTVYFGADTLIYRTIPRCDVDSVAVADAESRLKGLDIDPVEAYRAKSREEAAKQAEEAAKDDPNYQGKRNAAKKNEASAKGGSQAKNDVSARKDEADVSQREMKGAEEDMPDSLSFYADSLMTEFADSLFAVMPMPKDTTDIGFLTALRNVKIFRKNLQVVCDSLEYNDLDSLARLYKDPAIWNEVDQQYVADSIYAVIRNNAMEKASLMSESFIHIKEDSLLFDQIRGAEMMAYFDASGGLERFDALGGASALFYIEENGTFATVNKKESKMLSAVFVDGEINKIYYYDTAKSDAYPLVQLSNEDRLLKGFKWQPERRPSTPADITSQELRSPQRKEYLAHPKSEFKETDLYFPGYMDDIYVQIAVRDSIAKVREAQRAAAQREAEIKARHEADSIALADSLANIRSAADSLARADSLALADSLSVADSLSSAADSLASVSDSTAMADSLSVADSSGSTLAESSLTKAQLKEMKRKQREQDKENRKKRKEERWEAKDLADAGKDEARKAKRDAKLRERKLKAIREAEEQARKDAEALERYKLKLSERIERKAKRRSAKGKESLPLEKQPADL